MAFKIESADCGTVSVLLSAYVGLRTAWQILMTFCLYVMVLQANLKSQVLLCTVSHKIARCTDLWDGNNSGTTIATTNIL